MRRGSCCAAPLQQPLTGTVFRQLQWQQRKLICESRAKKAYSAGALLYQIQRGGWEMMSLCQTELEPHSPCTQNHMDSFCFGYENSCLTHTNPQPETIHSLESLWLINYWEQIHVVERQGQALDPDIGIRCCEQVHSADNHLEHPKWLIPRY